MLKFMMFILVLDAVVVLILLRKGYMIEQEMSSKLYVIEGMDGAGKNTQAMLLYDKMVKIYGDNYDVKLISFPNYGDIHSSSQVKEYLRGNCDVSNPYQSSLFYSVDRVYTMINRRGDNTLLSNFNKGKCIYILDRYTTSNMLHQGMHLTDREFSKYVKDMEMIEYKLCGLPKPDKVVYLDIDVDLSMKNIVNRHNNTGREIDIHESRESLDTVYSKKERVINKLKWRKIMCSDNGFMRDKEEISDEIFKYIMK